MSEEMTNLYYIRDTGAIVGNSCVWWRHNRKGYTCDIQAAGIYTEEESESICKDRSTDKRYLITDVLSLVQHHVDVQDLVSGKKIPYTIESLQTREVLEKENEELKKEIDQLKKQIEKMKDCGNCTQTADQCEWCVRCDTENEDDMWEGKE